MSERRFRFLGTALLASLLVATFRAHEIWRDEAQAWWLARAAPSFWSLLTGSARLYEGHPCLWFWLLRSVSRLSTSYLALQGVACALAVANAALILGLKALPRWQRALLACSYFTFFEFGVIARSYGLSLFFLLLALHALGSAHRLRLVSVAVLAGLAVNAVLLALPAAALLLGIACAEPLLATAGLAAFRPHKLEALPAAAGALVFAALVALALGTTSLPRDAVAQLAPWPVLNLNFVRELGSRLFLAFAPIPPLSADVWWNRSSFMGETSRNPLADSGWLASCGLVWACAWGWVLRRQAWLATALGLAVALVFTVVVRLPYRAIRYEGHVTLCLIVALCLAGARAPTLLRGRAFSVLFVLTFGAQALACAVAVVRDLREPFSQSKNVARYLQQAGAAALPIVGFEYYRMAPIAAYLDRPLYSPEHDRFISHGLWSSRWHHPEYFTATPAVRLRGVCWAAARATPARPGYLVASMKLIVPPELASELRLQASFSGSTVEEAWLYRVKSLSVSPELARLCQGQKPFDVTAGAPP